MAVYFDAQGNVKRYYLSNLHKGFSAFAVQEGLKVNSLQRL
jgi:hypothetical protein